LHRVVKRGGSADEDDGGEGRGLRQAEGHEQAAEGQDDRHPPGAGEAPADVSELRTGDPPTEEFAIPPETDENQQAPEENGKVGGVHFR